MYRWALLITWLGFVMANADQIRAISEAVHIHPAWPIIGGTLLINVLFDAANPRSQ